MIVASETKDGIWPAASESACKEADDGNGRADVNKQLVVPMEEFSASVRSAREFGSAMDDMERREDG